MDSQKVSDWYDAQCAGLGEQFLVAIAEVLLRLEENPELFPFTTVNFAEHSLAVFLTKSSFKFGTTL